MRKYKVVDAVVDSYVDLGLGAYVDVVVLADIDADVGASVGIFVNAAAVVGDEGRDRREGGIGARTGSTTWTRSTR